MSDRGTDDDVYDVSPATQALTVIPYAGAELAAVQPGDSWGTTTASADTAIAVVAPPREGRFTKIKRVLYENGATVHTLTCMVSQKEVAVVTEAAAGQAVVKFSNIPTLLDSAIFAAGDFFVVQDELGIFGAYIVTSISSNSVTITASVGSAGASGFTNKILADSPVWIVGAPADHPKRQYRMKASGDTEYFDLATSPNVNQPIVVHSNNITAQGYIKQMTYENPVI